MPGPAVIFQMKKQLAFLLLLLLTCYLQAQKLSPAPKVNLPPSSLTLSKADEQKLKHLEDTLKLLAQSITFDSVLENRKNACYAFIPKLVAALKTDNSFSYKFDSLENIARIYSPDSNFRIFTWQLVLPKGRFRYFGFIQMKSTKLKLFPLSDRSDTMQYHSQNITGNDNWYGALYYNIISKQADKKTIYTLFGFEGADVITRRKVLDILTFDDKGNPRFGAPLFYIQLQDDSTHYKKTDTLKRFFIEYKYNASTVFNYNPQLDMIVWDHVAPTTPKGNGATFSYVPDGTYEGFEWKNNRWNWVEKVFTFAIDEDDNPPIPVPLFGEPSRQPQLPNESPK